jgi:hypothetical protein
MGRKIDKQLIIRPFEPMKPESEENNPRTIHNDTKQN